MSKRNRSRRRLAQITSAPHPAVKDSGAFWGAGSYNTGWGGGTVGRNQNLSRSEWGAATAYEIMPEVNRAMNLRADMISSLPWYICRYDAAGNEVIIATHEDAAPKHPFASVLQWHMRKRNRSLLALMQFSNDLCGEVYLQKAVLENGQRVAVWLNPLACDPIIGVDARGDTAITYFQYMGQFGGKSAMFEPHEIAYYHTWSPVSDFLGQGLVQVVMTKINMSRNLDQFIEDFFANNARPSVIVSPTNDEPFTTVQKSQLQQQMDMFLKGRGNQFSTYVAPINAKFDMFDQPRIGDHYTIAPELSQYIYTVFGVPKALAGDDSGTQYKTGEDVKTAFFQMTIAPLANHIQEFINYSVMPYLDSTGAFFRFDTSEFDQVSEDDDKRSQIATRNYQAGLWTRNRALEYVKQPEIGTMDFLQIDGVPVPLENVPKYWEYKLTVRPNPNEAPALLQNNPAPVQPVTPAPEPQKDVTRSCVVMLSLANNTDLIALQNRLKEYLKETQVNWTDPNEFHVTVCYAPAVTAMQLATLQAHLSQLPAPVMQLAVGSFKSFDDMGQYALHFRIRANGDLADYQAQVWNTLQASSISASSYSEPDRYIPHITMGYAQSNPGAVTFDSKLTVSPSAVQLGDDTGIVKQWPVGNPQVIEGKAAQVSPEDELAAWQKKVQNKGYKAAFTPYLLRGDLGDWIVEALLSSNGDNSAIKQVFSQAREKLAYKAIQDTRLNFELEFETLLDSAVNGTTDRRTFAATLRYFLNKYGKQAYMDGLTDGGIETTDIHQLDDEDKGDIARLLSDQSQYVTDFGALLFRGDGITDRQAVDKPAMWFNKSVTPFYQAGLASADRNGLYEWVYGDTEHCDTCNTMNGQRHRMKDYMRKGILPQSDELDCHGFNCQCKLVKTTGKERGEWV